MKLIPKSKLSAAKKVDTLNNKKCSSKRQLDVLYQAQRAWDGLADLRLNRERLLRYTYGDQFCDIIDIDGSLMREDEYWATQGVIPKKNNLIRKMVRSVIGVYKNQNTDFTIIARDRQEQTIGEMMTITLHANRESNRMQELELRLFEEFVISSMAFIKESWGWRKGRKDTWSDIVNPNFIFFDGVMQDVRHWDCSIIGQIHDMTFADLCHTFAKSPDDVENLRQIYNNARDKEYISSYFSQRYYGNNEASASFFTPLDTNLCRIIEVWTKEQKMRIRCHDLLQGDFYKMDYTEEAMQHIASINQQRLQQAMQAGIPSNDVPFIETEPFVDSYWYYRYLTPLGDVLQEGETPFRHKEHPFTIKIHPFIDGKPHSLVEDSIDQQKFVNEMMTMYMLMAKHSAKGLLMFPEDLLPDDLSIDDIAEEWSKVNGMIVYKAKKDVPMPQQLSTNVNNFNISELLKIQMGMFDEVSGVTGALQGKTPARGTASSLYAQQAQNASNTLVDVLSSFSNFLKDATLKKVSNIQQFYTNRQTVIIAGAQYGGIKEYLPNLAQDAELDVSVSESAQSPAYRVVVNEMLMQLWQAQAIDVKQLLEVGHFPFADELLQSIKINEQQQQQLMQAQQQQQ